MLNTLRFKSSDLFEIYTLLHKSLRVLQLPTHLSNLTANGFGIIVDCIQYNVN